MAWGDLGVDVGAEARVEGSGVPVELEVDPGARLRLRGVPRLELVLVTDVPHDRARLPVPASAPVRAIPFSFQAVSVDGFGE